MPVFYIPNGVTYKFMINEKGEIMKKVGPLFLRIGLSYFSVNNTINEDLLAPLQYATNVH